MKGICVVGSASLTDVVVALAELNQRIGREVNPVVMPYDQFVAKLAAGEHLSLTRHAPYQAHTGQRRTFDPAGMLSRLIRAAAQTGKRSELWLRLAEDQCLIRKGFTKAELDYSTSPLLPPPLGENTLPSPSEGGMGGGRNDVELS